jgi:hypothetical protein
MSLDDPRSANERFLAAKRRSTREEPPSPRIEDDGFRSADAAWRAASAKVARPGAAQESSSLADDRKNRFDRHDDAVAGRRRDDAARAAREQRKADNKAKWQRRELPRGAGGTGLSQELQGLKAASDADRERRRRGPAVLPATSTIIATIDAWARQQSHFFESAFNYKSLVNAIVTGLAEEWFVLSVESVADLYVRLLAGGYLELPSDEYFDQSANGGAGAIVRKRSGLVSRSAPVMFPAYIWPANEAAQREQEIAQALQQHEAGRQSARTRSFSELQAEVRKSFRPPKPGGPRL